ncbi:MAG: hypothetical protein FJZ80_07500 [Bacteroidetes bacterium]|nr:hypothetical protein [Bacteroidota bacterium]MBM3424898.1 hypothetical protein [Bacteroidota bacterium]
MNKFLILLFGTSLLLGSCIEIIDDLSINMDGSGVFKYTINLSSSKIKVNSILALDSFNGKKVPKIEEIETKIGEFKLLLEKEKGINSVQTEFNKVDFIVKISVNFSRIDDLQTGIKSVIVQLDPSSNIHQEESTWIGWDAKTLQRIVPKIIEERIKADTQTDDELLKMGSYTCISRLPKSIQHSSNPQCKLNPAKTAAMLRVNTFDMKLNPGLLEHSLTLSP